MDANCYTKYDNVHESALPDRLAAKEGANNAWTKFTSFAGMFLA